MSRFGLATIAAPHGIGALI